MRKKPLRVGPGGLTRLHSPEEVFQTLMNWLGAYGQDRDGIDADSFLWHIFSSGRYPSETGPAARSSYEQAIAHEYVVLSNDRKIAFTTDQRPETCSLADYYVFPPNLAWTMAFTHEDGWLGPYFARHRHFEALDLENKMRVRKAIEAEVARRRGWR